MFFVERGTGGFEPFELGAERALLGSRDQPLKLKRRNWIEKIFSGKVSDLMGDFGKGINSFKKGLAEKDDPKVINAEDTNKDKTTV